MSVHSSLLEAMREAIAPNFHLTVATSDNSLTIKETESKSVCKWVTIKLKKSMPYLAFSIDKKRKKDQGDPIYPFFNPQVPCICSKNDTVLCIQKAKKIYILLVELKSENPKGYLKQLLATKGLVEFIWQRLQLCNSSLKNQHDLEFRGLLFFSRQIPNEGTTKRKSISFKKESGLLVTKLECHNIYFVQQFFNAK